MTRRKIIHAAACSLPLMLVCQGAFFSGAEWALGKVRGR